MPEQRTVDTPNDMNIREQQKIQRLAQGKAIAEQSKVLPARGVFSPAYTFRFRQWKNTQFSGLWELAALNREGKVEKIISDADSLPELLESISNIFANAGF